MNVFEHNEERRRRLDSLAPGAWTRFKAELESLVNSYNQTTQGQRYRAGLKQLANGCGLIIERSEGVASDRWHILTMALTVMFNGSKYIVTARLEYWIVSPDGMRRAHCDKKTPVTVEMTMELESDDAASDVVIVRENQRFTIAQAAEFIALSALGTPGSAS